MGFTMTPISSVGHSIQGSFSAHGMVTKVTTLRETQCVLPSSGILFHVNPCPVPTLFAGPAALLL